MKKLLFMILSCSFLLTSNAVGQQGDVEGWTQARWGMTEDEVSKTFEHKVARIENPKSYDHGTAYCPLVIYDVEIGKYKYSVNFVFDNETKTLVKVIIRPDNKKPSEVQFHSLEQQLTEKYGPPSYSKDDKHPDTRISRTVIVRSTYSYKRAWNYPSTIIELNYLDARELDDQILTIVYRKNDKAKRENL